MIWCFLLVFGYIVVKNLFNLNGIYIEYNMLLMFIKMIYKVVKCSGGYCCVFSLNLVGKIVLFFFFYWNFFFVICIYLKLVLGLEKVKIDFFS